MDGSDRESFEEVDEDTVFDAQLEDLSIDDVPRDSPDSFVKVDIDGGVESSSNTETDEEGEEWTIPETANDSKTFDSETELKDKLSSLDDLFHLFTICLQGYDSMLFSDLTIRNLLLIDQRLSDIIGDSKYDAETKNHYIAKFFQMLGDLFAGRCAARKDLLKDDREKVIEYTILCYSVSLHYSGMTNYGNSKEKAKKHLNECEMTIILDHIRNVYDVKGTVFDIISEEVGKQLSDSLFDEADNSFLKSFDFTALKDCPNYSFDFEKQFLPRLDDILYLKNDDEFLHRLLYIFGYARLNNYSHFKMIFPGISSLSVEEYGMNGFDSFLIFMNFAVSYCKLINYRFGYEFNYHVSVNNVVERQIGVSDVDDPTIMFISPSVRHCTPSPLAQLFWNAFKLIVWEQETNLEFLICKEFQHKDVIKELFSKLTEIINLKGSYVQLSSVVERFYLLYGLVSSPENIQSVDIKAKLLAHAEYIEQHIDDEDDLDLDEKLAYDGVLVDRIFPTVDFTELFQKTIFVLNHVRIMQDIAHFMIKEMGGADLDPKYEQILENMSKTKKNEQEGDLNETNITETKNVDEESSAQVDSNDEEQDMADEHENAEANVSDEEEDESEDEDDSIPVNHDIYCYKKLQNMDVILQISDLLTERKEKTFGAENGPTWRDIIESARTGTVLPKIDTETMLLINDVQNVPEKHDKFELVHEDLDNMQNSYSQKLFSLKAAVFLGQQGYFDFAKCVLTNYNKFGTRPLLVSGVLLEKLSKYFVDYKVPVEKQFILRKIISTNYDRLSSSGFILTAVDFAGAIDVLVLRILSHFGVVAKQIPRLAPNAGLDMNLIVANFAKELTKEPEFSQTNKSRGKDAFKVAFEQWRGISEDIPEPVRAQKLMECIAPALTPQQIAGYKPTHINPVNLTDIEDTPPSTSVKTTVKAILRRTP
uniref:Uncharacterized protein n=1 Tax=Panagrolaimus sp. JU765 TaxID=591449 RepID=A0AC34QHU9_9BILA